MLFRERVELAKKAEQWMEENHVATTPLSVITFLDIKGWLKQAATGKWIPFDLPWYQCSECGAVRENKSFMENFCPNCGADMRGNKKDG